MHGPSKVRGENASKIMIRREGPEYHKKVRIQMQWKDIYRILIQPELAGEQAGTWKAMCDRKQCGQNETKERGIA